MHSAAVTGDRDTARTVEIVTDLAGLDRLAPDWQRLQTRAGGVTFFQSHAWCAFCIRRRQSRYPNSAEPAIVVVRDAGVPVLIWPLAVRHSGGVSLAHDLTEPFAQYSDALCDPQADIESLLDAAWAALTVRHIDGLVLRKVRTDAAIHHWLSRRAHLLGEPLQAPAVALSSFSDHAGYRRTLAAKTRKNLRNLRNRLAREGTLVHETITNPAARARLIEQCFLDRADWLEAGGLSSTAFADPSFTDIVRGLAGDGAAPPVTVMRLALDRGGGSEPDTVSLHWGFDHGDRYYCFMAAKNPAFDAFSPGRLHLEDVVSACAGRGIATVDFLPPAMAYKSSQATGAVTVSAFGLPLTLRGRLTINGWHGYLRPAIKKAVLATPASIRRMIFKTAVR